MIVLHKHTKVVDHVKEDFKDYYLIEGTPSPDLIATIATRYLVDTLHLVKVAHVESPSIMPVIRVTEGTPEYPIRIYASKKHKILVLLADQVINPDQMFSFSKAILEWCERKKVKGIISLLGMVPSNSQPGIFGAANKKSAQELLIKNDVKMLESGLISGISAQILILAKIDACLLLANPGNSTNFSSAAKLLELLGNMFGLQVDTKPLEQESKKIVAAIKEKMQQMYKQQQALRGEKKEDKGMMFV